jgi:hypothetical protein
MATIECLDLRQPDERDNFLPNPYWLRSGVITKDGDDLGSLLFSFPKLKGAVTIVHCAAFEITQVFDGTATITIGLGTLATDAITTGGDITIVDLDEYFEVIDETSTGWTFPTTSDLFDKWTAGTPEYITHADATVPCVYGTLTASSAITTGRGRLHLLVSTLWAQ